MLNVFQFKYYEMKIYSSDDFQKRSSLPTGSRDREEDLHIQIKRGHGGKRAGQEGTIVYICIYITAG